MKKIIAAVILIFIFTAGCSTKDSINSKFVVGEVEVVGNEPFINLAVKINPTSVYILNCDNETKTFLFKNQGKMIKIFYDSIDNDKTPKEIFVKKAEIFSGTQN